MTTAPDSGIPVTDADLRGACDAALADDAIPKPQKPSIGTIKRNEAPENFTGEPAV